MEQSFTSDNRCNLSIKVSSYPNKILFGHKCEWVCQLVTLHVWRKNFWTRNNFDGKYLNLRNQNWKYSNQQIGNGKRKRKQDLYFVKTVYLLQNILAIWSILNNYAQEIITKLPARTCPKIMNQVQFLKPYTKTIVNQALTVNLSRVSYKYRDLVLFTLFMWKTSGNRWFTYLQIC